jgi:hypothetical protein
MELDERVQQSIEALVRDRFRDSNIVSVDVKQGDEFDDDAVIYVTVVFEADSVLNAGETVSITRRTRDQLRQKGSSAPFPVFSFVSTDDADRHAAVA